MHKIVPIIEGPGEVDAAPELIRKVASNYQRNVLVGTPKNAHGVGSLTVAGGLERFLQLAFNDPQASGVLVLRDADEECSVNMAFDFARRALALSPKIPVAIVVAKCEYEAWFLASLASIAGKPWNGHPGIPAKTTCDAPEAVGDAKGWITRRLPGSRAYKETIDQLALTHMLSVEHAHMNSRSFQRLCTAIVELCDAIDRSAVVVTPYPPPAATDQAKPQ